MYDDEFITDWEKIKPLVFAKWDRLRRDDFTGYHPTVRDLTNKIQEKYDLPRETIEQDIRNLGSQFQKLSGL